jgi:hypothetical protein
MKTTHEPLHVDKGGFSSERPYIYTYVYLQVLFESLFSSAELFNMTVFRNFEVMLRHAELLCVEFC